MKVLMVSEDIPHPHLGGLGKHALSLAHELHRLGHQVDILGNADQPITQCPGQAGPGRFFADIRGHAKGWKQQALGVFHAPAVLLTAAALARSITRHAPGYDVIHYHGHLPWVAAALPDDLPFVQTRHDQGGDCALKTRYRPEHGRCTTLDPAACANCAAAAPTAIQTAVTSQAVGLMRRRTHLAYQRHPVIFVSQFLQDGFAAASGQAPQGQVIYNAIDLTPLRAALAGAPTAGADLEVRLFSAGALFAYKGYQALLEALARQPLPPGVYLAIAGDGPQLAALKALAAAQPRVALLGWQPYDRVLAHLAVADAVIVPSDWDEPCSTSILEALAMGRQVLALRRGGTPELAAYAQPGQLQLFNTVEELATACAAQARQPGPPAAAQVPFAGTMAHMAAAVLAVYSQLIAR